MSRWAVVARDEPNLAWRLRCPSCLSHQTESQERLDRLAWPQHPHHTAPDEPKPMLLCRSCGYEPHLPGPSDLDRDLGQGKGAA